MVIDYCIVSYIHWFCLLDARYLLCSQLYDIRAMKELEAFRGHRKDVTGMEILFTPKVS